MAQVKKLQSGGNSTENYILIDGVKVYDTAENRKI